MPRYLLPISSHYVLVSKLLCMGPGTEDPMIYNAIGFLHRRDLPQQHFSFFSGIVKVGTFLLFCYYPFINPLPCIFQLSLKLFHIFSFLDGSSAFSAALHYGEWQYWLSPIHYFVRSKSYAAAFRSIEYESYLL